MPKYEAIVQFEATDAKDAEAYLLFCFPQYAERKVSYTSQLCQEGPAEGSVDVYTDGGCYNGVGAWAFVILGMEAQPIERVDTATETTNNRMEMVALIKALEFIPMGSKITVFSDSEYLIKGITQWCTNWKKNSWRTYTGSPVKNKDLWEVLINLVEFHTLKFQHVKGHADNKWNNRCDEMCTWAMQELKLQRPPPPDMDPYHR